MTKRTWITVTAALAMLCTVSCKKEETTPPEGDVAVAEDDDEVSEPEEPEDDAEPEASILTKGSFDETINDHFDAVSDCYLSALETKADLEGKLNAEFTIGGDGVVTSVTAVEGSTLDDEALVQCISDAAKSWGFDKPSGDEMKLRYEFNLAPG
ncbi:AgmX/PglI C-terminal domain-containing protein [Enhygromyxa salina]|nr:AgmX/PglI C-terminal domain-containing protein [Enhygromyxa salina]